MDMHSLSQMFLRTSREAAGHMVQGHLSLDPLTVTVWHLYTHGTSVLTHSARCQSHREHCVPIQPGTSHRSPRPQHHPCWKQSTERWVKLLSYPQ